MSAFILHNYFRSSTSYRVRIAMHLKGLSFEYHPVHLLNNGGEQHTAEYRQLNPLGEVPTLQHGEFKLAQSMAIIEYLDTIVPQARLIPTEPQAAAKVRQFCENINCAHAYGNLKTLAYLEKSMGMSANQKLPWIQHWAHQSLAVSEKWLTATASTYSFGEQVTAADLFLVPQVFSAKRFEVDMTAYPNIQRVVANCEKLEAFQKAHPHRQIDTPPELALPSI